MYRVEFTITCENAENQWSREKSNLFKALYFALWVWLRLGHDRDCPMKIKIYRPDNSLLIDWK